MRLSAGAGFCACLLLVVVPTSVVVAQQSSQALRHITIDDYFQIRRVSDPQVSPDGQFVTYTVETALLKEDKNEDRIWMASTKGGDAIPLTAAGVSSSHARWSPDGRSIAFLSARDEGKAQVWLLPRWGGEAERLTDTPQGVEDFAWSPNSGQFVLVLRDPSPEELEATNEKKNKAVVKEKRKARKPWVVDRLQFKMDEVGYLDRRRTHLYVFNLAGKTLTQITSGDFDDSEPAWSPDGTQNLCRIPAAGGEIARSVGGRLMVNDYALAKTGEVVAQVAMIDRPDELYAVSNGKLTQITHSNDALFSQLKLSQGEYVHFKSK